MHIVVLLLSLVVHTMFKVTTSNSGFITKGETIKVATHRNCCSFKRCEKDDNDDREEVDEGYNYVVDLILWF